ncbi:MAG: hypothetical protein WBA53_10730 [Burkholderiaceae bacterium]
MKSAVILSATIVATAFVAAMGLYLYFSPYHSCVRVLRAADYEPADAALACLHGVERDVDTEPAYGGSRALQRLVPRHARSARVEFAR